MGARMVIATVVLMCAPARAEAPFLTCEDSRQVVWIDPAGPPWEVTVHRRLKATGRTDVTWRACSYEEGGMMQAIYSCGEAFGLTLTVGEQKGPWLSGIGRPPPDRFRLGCSRPP